MRKMQMRDLLDMDLEDLHVVIPSKEGYFSEDKRLKKRIINVREIKKHIELIVKEGSINYHFGLFKDVRVIVFDNYEELLKHKALRML